VTTKAGPAGRTVAVVAHGAGSCGAVAAAILAATQLGVDAVLPVEDRTSDVELVQRALAARVDQARAGGAVVRFVAGISLGAHAVARWACSGGPPDGLAGLLLVMPAWTGPPDEVAALTAAAADDVAAHGSSAVLARLRDDPTTRGDWVVSALADGWACYDDETLVAALRRAARSPAPEVSDLQDLDLPVGLAALEDDPLHPAAVARAWAAALPRAAVESVGRHAPSAGLGVLGAAAARAWRASGSR
jgi:hypothetical protein